MGDFLGGGGDPPGLADRVTASRRVLLGSRPFAVAHLVDIQRGGVRPLIWRVLARRSAQRMALSGSWQLLVVWLLRVWDGRCCANRLAGCMG